MEDEARSVTRLDPYVDSLSYSPIREMLELANDSTHEDLVHLEIGEPDFDTPAHIVDAAMRSASAGHTHYTSSRGIRELREAIADRDGASVAFDPETEITVTTGAMEALFVLLESVVRPGSDVVVPTPAWPNYFTQIRLAGGSPVEVALSPETGYALDPTRVIDAMSEETAAVLLCSPSNPTGRVYSRSAVAEVIDAAAATETFVIADEVYDGLVYGDRPTGIPGYTDHDEYVLTVNSCSKKYAMTGWRLGWAAGPADVIDAATKVSSYVTACPSSVSQHAAIAALTGTQEPAENMAKAFRERRELVTKRLAEIPHISAPEPDGAIYALVDVSALPGTSVEVARRLLTEYGVVTAPGDGFGEGGQGTLRLSFANDGDRLEIGLRRIEELVRDELGR